MNKNNSNVTHLSQQEKNEKQIISLLLNNSPYFSKSDLIVNQSMVVTESFVPSYEKIQSRHAELLKSTYINWLQINKESYFIQYLFEESWLSNSISRDKSDALIEDYEQRWTIHHTFSRVGFSYDGRQALIYWCMWCPGGLPQCGTIYLFELTQKQWYKKWQQKGYFGVFNQ